MTLIDLDKLNELLDSEIESNKENIANAVQNGWYDKAARLDVQNESISKAKFLANSGDCHVNKSN